MLDQKLLVRKKGTDLYFVYRKIAGIITVPANKGEWWEEHAHYTAILLSIPKEAWFS